MSARRHPTSFVEPDPDQLDVLSGHAETYHTNAYRAQAQLPLPETHLSRGFPRSSCPRPDRLEEVLGNGMGDFTSSKIDMMESQGIAASREQVRLR